MLPSPTPQRLSCSDPRPASVYTGLPNPEPRQLRARTATATRRRGLTGSAILAPFLTATDRYSAHQTVAGRAEGVTHVGLMRADAELYSTEIPERPKSTRGPKPKKGRRLPNPREIAREADRN